ncbi:MAG: nucleotidyl transferase AbiEii/AbiGii toxin family protein [Bacteroidota bacterium]|nr:nucleotidyl transferase AbiEii/AbiGii toxin family protein [Bacteroidota bacterium]
MQHNANFEVLTANQQLLLKVFGASEISKHYYLTGGTALSAFYLQHRYSEDLDFFTGEKRHIEQFRKEIVHVLNISSGKLEIIRSFESFIEARLTMNNGEVIKIDFAYDSPFRHEDTVLNDKYQIQIDSLLDIGCNKISTVFERADVKDFVDLFFLLKKHFQFDELWGKAKQKHVGLDEYWFCQALARVVHINRLPKMIEPIDLGEMKKLFLDLHDQITKTIDS